MAEIINEIKRLKHLRFDSEVASLLNYNRVKLTNMKIRNTIPFADLLSFCKREKINFEWLLAGEAPEGDSTLSDGILSSEFVLVPKMEGAINAGQGVIPELHVEFRVAFRRDWISRKGDPRQMSLIRVTGDSMTPTLLAGDVVLVDHRRNFVDPQGGIYAININDAIMIKRIQVQFATGRLRIISDNPHYETFEVEQERIRINGRVIWFARELE